MEYTLLEHEIPDLFQEAGYLQDDDFISCVDLEVAILMLLVEYTMSELFYFVFFTLLAVCWMFMSKSWKKILNVNKYIQKSF